MTETTIADAAIRWYDANARDLPWRVPGTTAWAVLVSEVMLQQTPVVRVTPAWHAWMDRWPTPADLAADPPSEAIRMWGRLGYPRRAMRLHACAVALVERHGGEVPADLEALVRLPGVGRKTANVLLGVGFGIAEGVVVDTHVKRIAHRWGLTREEEPERVEQDLIPLVPPEERVHFTHRTIDHGRAVCTARRPYCERCALAELCPTAPAVYRTPAADAAVA